MRIENEAREKSKKRKAQGEKVIEEERREIKLERRERTENMEE